MQGLEVLSQLYQITEDEDNAQAVVKKICAKRRGPMPDILFILDAVGLSAYAIGGIVKASPTTVYEWMDGRRDPPVKFTWRLMWAVENIADVMGHALPHMEKAREVSKLEVSWWRNWCETAGKVVELQRAELMKQLETEPIHRVPLKSKMNGAARRGNH